MTGDRMLSLFPRKGFFDSDVKMPARREKKARRAGEIGSLHYPNVHSPVNSSSLRSGVADPGHGLSITDSSHAG